MVRQLLETTPANVAEWILYMDSESLFSDPSVTFAFEFYGGRDIILTGSAAGIMATGIPSESPSAVCFCESIILLVNQNCHLASRPPASVSSLSLPGYSPSHLLGLVQLQSGRRMPM